MNFTIKTFTTALVAIVLLISFIGTAYAIANLTSQTDIDQNTIESESIVITSDDYHDVLSSISFHTVNTAGTITYNPILDSKIGGSAVNNATLISDAFSISVAQTNVTGTYNLTVTVTGFSPVAGLTYTMKVGTTEVAYTAGAWSFTGLAFGTSYDVALYISGTATADPGTTAGFTNYVQDSEEGSVFTFLATAPNA